MTHLHLDIESRSRVDLIKHGLDVYSKDSSTRIMMIGWAIDNDDPEIWLSNEKAPAALRDALRDPSVSLWAHNAQFERVMLSNVLGMNLKMSRWRCTQVMCYYAGLAGKLEEAGRIIGLGDDLAKLANDGRRLIRKFCVPRKPTKAKPYEWHTAETDPEDWDLFIRYCLRDVVAEREIAKKLSRFSPPDFVWEEYILDQKINDRGMPVDRTMAQQAIRAALDFKTNGVRDLARRTGLANPMSNKQALPWLQERGYPFNDLRKQTVAKAADIEPSPMTPEAAEIIVTRSELNKASVKKYDALIARIDHDDRLRFNFQFLGAMRTGRFAGRAVQLQNLARPAKAHEKKLAEMREALRDGDLEELRLLGGSNLLASLSSLLRPVFATKPGRILRVADLSSIEDRKVAWLAGCETILREHREGLDPYKAFGVHLYNKQYDQLTKEDRNNSKPGRLGCFAADTLVLTDSGLKPIVQVAATDKVHDGTEWVTHDGAVYQGDLETVDFAGVDVTPDHKILTGHGWRTVREIQFSHGKTVGRARTEPVYDILNAGPLSRFVIVSEAGPLIVHNCCYRLSAGQLARNKNGDEIKTGLWGYAESMHIPLSQDECVSAVRAYRNAYPEIVQHWYDLEQAVQKTILTRKPVEVGKVRFDIVAPYLRCHLPSGRVLHYLRPKLEQKEFTSNNGSTYTKTAISYEGSDPVTKQWGRIYTHGGKLLENICQASARDVLVFHMGLAMADGFDVVGHVHDELIAEHDVDDDYHTVARLEEIMSISPPWCADLPLGAAGYESTFYRKD